MIADLMVPRTRSLALLLTVGLLARATIALGQEGAVPPAEPEPPPIQAIPLEDIATQAERTAIELQAMLPTEESKTALGQIETDFEAARKEIAASLKKTRSALPEVANLRTLQDLETQLLGLLAPLDEWDLALAPEARQVAGALQQLEGAAEVWKKTQAEARAAGASEVSLRRIASTRRDIDEGRRPLVARRDRIAALQDRFLEQRTSVDRLVKDVRAAIQVRMKGVFAVDRTPLWDVNVLESLDEELTEGWTDPLIARLERVGEYARENGRALAFQLVLFLSLAVGLRALGTRARERVEESGELREATQVFELPTAMALVISLALTPQLHPLAPRLFTLIIGTFAVVPAVVIVHRLTPQVMVPLIFGLLVFFLADRARAVLETVPVLERLILLGELVGAVAFLAWLMRPSRFARLPAEAQHDRVLRVIGVALRIALVLFSLALLADVVGLGDLADLLATGTLRSAYSGLFIYALLKVVQSLLAYGLVVRPLRLLRAVSQHRALVRRRLGTGLRATAILVWGYVTLVFFGLEASALSGLGRLVSANLNVGAISISLGDVGAFAVAVWLSFALARFVSFILEEDVYPRVRLARGVPYAVSSLVRYTLIFLGFLFALAAAGIELGKLTVVAGGLGVGIGFGLQSVVNNFVSGLILLFERPLQVGDVVQLPNLWGEIRRIGIRASTIRTWDGAEVVVPNGLLISDTVTNWTLSDRRRRLEVKVGVEYGTDAQRVIDLLLEVARAHRAVLTEPEPSAYFLNFGDSALEFMLRAWIPEFDEGYSIRSDITVAIQRALAEAGITVPFPQRDLHVRTISPDAASELGKRGAG
jgi:small-conductance mechanosensitive channel